jgi:hypothetical protein
LSVPFAKPICDYRQPDLAGAPSATSELIGWTRPHGISMGVGRAEGGYGATVGETGSGQPGCTNVPRIRRCDVDPSILTYGTADDARRLLLCADKSEAGSPALRPPQPRRDRHRPLQAFYRAGATCSHLAEPRRQSCYQLRKCCSRGGAISSAISRWSCSIRLR